MEKNELQINNNISLEKNNTQTVNFEEQKSFLETNLGQVINAGVDLGIRALLPGFLEENVIEIKKQVRKVIELLEQRIILEPGRPILKTLYDRYMKAEEIISSNEDISKIMISGGCRAYLDAFSDYMNPLLGEMDKAEKMLSNLKK